MEILIYLTATVAVIFAVYLILVFPGSKRKRSFAQRLFAPYAHRGLHDGTTPENSIAAFKKAVNAGYGIELDIQLSSDGEVMVFHDYTLDRMTEETGLLKDRTSVELGEIKLLETEEHIPTLSEVLETVSGKVPLLIELKGESLNTDLCVAANKILSEYKGDYCIESFNPILVSWYAKNKPEIMRGQLYTDFCQKLKFSPLNIVLTLMILNFMAKPDFIAYDIMFKNAVPVKIATGLFGAKKFTWAVKSEHDHSVARNTGSYPIFEETLPQKNT